MPGKFKSYMENIRTATGKSPEDFWILANEKGFVKGGKVAAKPSEMLAWLKGDLGLGHVRANFIVLYLRLRANDPKVSNNMKKWAFETGYEEYRP